jgi:succinate dehydrogenase / fumarate reductase cytochrome b subunit
MSQEDDQQRSPFVRVNKRLAAQKLKGAIDAGRTGDKVAFGDPGAAPLGTDDEAAGTPDTADRVAVAMRQELNNNLISKSGRPATAKEGWLGDAAVRGRPRSPNIQIYRPQLTSVLSVLNRITGIFLTACAVVLVVWLVAAATGPQAYGAVQGAVTSPAGQLVLLGATFAFFLHLCGGIRHLFWDTVHGFALRSVYLSGWAVVAASMALTIIAWVLSSLLKG